MIYPKEIERRFWSKVKLPDSIGTNECWLWMAAPRDHKGYGSFDIQGKSRIASRVTYELCVGPIPDGMQVLHNCPVGDNPAYVNPAHLWIGTHADNMADRRAKGHYNDLPSGDEHWIRKHHRRAIRDNKGRYVKFIEDDQ